MAPLICPACGAQTPRLATSPAASINCLRCRAPIPPEQLAPPVAEPGTEGTGTEPTTLDRLVGAGFLNELSQPHNAGPAYRVEKFQPTRGGSPVGVIVAVVAGLIGAVVLGAASALLRQFFWLVLVFPALLGFGIGAATSGGAWLAKCRRPELIAGAGVIAGLVGALVLHYVSYLIAVANIPQAQIGFQQYLDLRCQAGVLGLGYVGSAIYYVVEAVVIVGAAGTGALTWLDGPFCETCRVWKKKEGLGTFRMNTAVAARAVGSGQPASMIAPPDGNETVTLEFFRCPHCLNDAPIDVRVTCTKANGKDTATAVVFVTYPGTAAPAFEAVRRACGS